MSIKRESGIDLKGLHDRKTRAVRVAEFLIFEFKKEFPSPFFVFPLHGNKGSQSTVFQPSAKSPAMIQPSRLLSKVTVSSKMKLVVSGDLICFSRTMPQQNDRDLSCQPRHTRHR